MAVQVRQVRTVYPCCGRRSLFRVTTVLPRESYDRRCPECGTRYLVERRTRNIGPTILDILEWTDKATRLYQEIYGR